MKKTFSVLGMTCSACSSGIERNLSKLNGIKYVNVSLIEKTMTIEFNPEIIKEQTIIEVVEKLGYQVDTQNKVDKLSYAKKLKSRFFVSLGFLIPLMYLCLGKMLKFPVFSDDRINFSIQFVLSVVIIVINSKFFISGTKALFRGVPNMDTLVSLGSAASFIYSVIATVMLFCGKQVSHVFYDSSAMVLALVTLGKWFEELSKVKTGNEIEKLGNLLPKVVTVVKDGKEYTVLTAELQVGDVIVLKAGDYVCVDGVVTEGHATIDKSVITGESIPTEILVGEKITSGSILVDGYLCVKAENVGEQTLFSKVVEIVKNAGASKAPVQRFADKVSGIFVPIVSLLAIITFILWILITKDVYTALRYSISVLVISCPCALGLATPVAIMVATGKAASMGVLFKNAESLQKACEIDCVLLDKTATITTGKPKVVDFKNYSGMHSIRLNQTVSALESKSKHPLAQSVIDYCGKSERVVSDYQYVIGKGIIGTVDGVRYYIGNRELLPKKITVDESLTEYDGSTIIYFADDFELIAIFVVADFVKPDSLSAIEKLRSMGIETVMVTGDNQSVAQKIGKEVGIEEIESQVLPDEKCAIVEKYKSQNKVVAMVGDGINDSPALKSANVGIAMGTGMDIAIDSADVIIVNGSLNGVADTISISKKANRIIKGNLLWAFLYNVIAIPIAAGVLASLGVSLTPWMASVCMSISSLFVVNNSLRIVRKTKNKGAKQSEKLEIYIDGMMCNHCVSKVKTALENICGEGAVFVSLEKEKATITNVNVAQDKLINAIENLGFKVKEIKK